MKVVFRSQWALVGVTCCFVLVFAFSLHPQQRVQTTTQLAVRTPVVVADPLAEWEPRFGEAMQVADELISSGQTDYGRRLASDLEALDEALREYVRASERLRHKDRAVSATLEFLVLQNALQMESRQYDAVSNALKARQDAEMSSIRNTK